MTTLSAGLHRPMIVRLAIASPILITDRANSHLRLSPLLLPLSLLPHALFLLILPLFWLEKRIGKKVLPGGNGETKAEAENS